MTGVMDEIIKSIQNDDGSIKTHEEVCEEVDALPPIFVEKKAEPAPEAALEQAAIPTQEVVSEQAATSTQEAVSEQRASTPPQAPDPKKVKI